MIKLENGTICISLKEIEKTNSYKIFIKENTGINGIMCREDEVSQIIERGLFYGMFHPKYTSLIEYNENYRIEYNKLLKNIKDEIEKCDNNDK